MTGTPLIDELNQLGPAGRELLDQRVDLFFAAHPGASANDAWRAIGGSRVDVLDSVRQVLRGTTGPSTARGEAA